MGDDRPTWRPFDDRAVSDVLGFIMVFSLVISSVALVSVFGLQALEDTRDNEEVNNAKRAFDVLRDNLEDIHRQGAPSRATEISLENSQLKVGDPVSINVTGVNQSGFGFSNTYTFEPIIFESRTETDIVYSGGAVFLDPRSGGIMLQEPPILIGSDRVVFPIIETESTGDVTSVGGATVRIRAENVGRQPLRGNFTSSATQFKNFTVNITSPRSSLWRNYLEDQTDMQCNEPKEDTTLCRISSIEGDSLFVTRTLMRYEFEN